MYGSAKLPNDALNNNHLQLQLPIKLPYHYRNLKFCYTHHSQINKLLLWQFEIITEIWHRNRSLMRHLENFSWKIAFLVTLDTKKRKKNHQEMKISPKFLLRITYLQSRNTALSQPSINGWEALNKKMRNFNFLRHCSNFTLVFRFLSWCMYRIWRT